MDLDFFLPNREQIMKLTALLLIGLFFAQTATVFAKDTADQQFEKLADQYITEYIKMNPEHATSLGEHKI